MKTIEDGKRQGKKNANAEAYEKIQQLILSMEIKPGESVTETSLSEKLGIGRTPVREALKKLEQEGLIVTSNGRKRVYILTIKETEEIFDLKICVESAIAAWATQRGSDNDFGKLEGILEEMKAIAAEQPTTEKEEDARLNRWLEKDRILHATIFRMADNAKADQLVKNLNIQWHRLRVGIYAMEGRMEKAALEHEDFVKAILERRPEKAMEAMRDHMENLKKELVKLLKLFHYP